MEPTEQLTSEQRENLVAYLDGELDESATEEMERVLSRSSAARREVEMLTRTWELLDTLARPDTSGEFTEKTLSAIRVAEVGSSETSRFRPAFFKRGLFVAVWCAGLTLAGVMGFSASHNWGSDGWEGIAEDLPVVEKYDVYSDVGDIEFLQELKKSGLFNEDVRKNESSSEKVR